MDNAVELTTHHLGIEVGDLRAVGAVGGAELLKHLLERHALTADAASPVLVGDNIGVLLTGLALADHEEAVILTTDVEGGTCGLALTDAQTVGQQLHGLDVVADVVHQLVARGEVVGVIIVGVVSGHIVTHSHHQDRVAVLVGGSHVIGADVPTATDGAVIHLALAVAVLVIGTVLRARDVRVAIDLLQQGDNLIGVGSLVCDRILVRHAAGIGPLILDGIIVCLRVNRSLSLGTKDPKRHQQGCKQPKNALSHHDSM